MFRCAFVFIDKYEGDIRNSWREIHLGKKIID